MMKQGEETTESILEPIRPTNLNFENQQVKDSDDHGISTAFDDKTNKKKKQKKANGPSLGYCPGMKIASVTNGGQDVKNNVHSEGAASINHKVNDLLHPKQECSPQAGHGQQETADLSQESDRDYMAISNDVTDNQDLQTGNDFYDRVYVDIRAQTKPTQMAGDEDSEQSKEEYSDSDGWSSDDSQTANGDLCAGDGKLMEKPIGAKKRKCHGRKNDKQHKIHAKTRNKNGKYVHRRQTPITVTGTRKQANEKTYLDKKVEGVLGISTEMIGNRTWRERAAKKNEEDVRVWMKSRDFTIIIATDGSYKGRFSALASAVWIAKVSLDKPYSTWSEPRMGRSSSFVAECNAFEIGLQCAEQHTHPDDSIVILTDCRTLVEELGKNNINSSWEKGIRNLSGRLTVAYVPGHCGISYNETVDRLARETRKSLESDNSKTEFFYE